MKKLKCKLLFSVFFFTNLSDVSINTPIKVLEILVETICVS